MSIRPLDIGLTVQRTTDINCSQTNEGIRPEIAMQQSADKVHKDVQAMEQSVLQTNEIEKQNVDQDGEGRGGGEGRRGRGKKKEHEKKSEPLKYSGILDVSI